MANWISIFVRETKDISLKDKDSADQTQMFQVLFYYDNVHYSIWSYCYR